MAVAFRALQTNQFIRYITKPTIWCLDRRRTVIFLSSGLSKKSCCLYRPVKPNYFGIHSIFLRYSSTQCETPRPDPKRTEEKSPKEGMIQKLKTMYKQYWYVVVPVHLVTSAIWFGSAYYAVRSGLDVIAIVEYLEISEKIIAPLKESGAGYVAFALALYKLVTPLRYAVTLGATTFTIKRLIALGWIKPMPTKERFKEIIQEKKENYYDRKTQYQDHMKERRDHLMDEMKRYKKELKDRVKKM